MLDRPRRWLSMRLECIGACLVFCGAITSAVVLQSRYLPGLTGFQA